MISKVILLEIDRKLIDSLGKSPAEKSETNIHYVRNGYYCVQYKGTPQKKKVYL